MKNIILQTDRLYAVIPTMESLENRYKLLSDQRACKFLGNGESKNMVEVESFLKKNIEHYEKFGFCLFDIHLKEGHQFIGDAGLIYEALNPENKNIEVGYRLLPEFWGRGYATEIAKAFIDWGFQEVGLSRIVAFYKPENTASFNVMQKIGMNYDGKALYDGKKECEMCGINNYVIETEEFALRPFQARDSELLYDLWNDLDVVTSMECDPIPVEKIAEKLARYKSWMDNFGFTNFAVFDKDTNDFIGSCGFSLFHDPARDRNPFGDVDAPKYENRDVEIGYVLRKKYWGRGIAFKLAIACVEFISEKNPDVKRIVAVTTLNNLASQKILEKLGFEFIDAVESEEYGKERFYCLR